MAFSPGLSSMTAGLPGWDDAWSVRRSGMRAAATAAILAGAAAACNEQARSRGRQDAGQRRLRRHGAAVEHDHPPTGRNPQRPWRSGHSVTFSQNDKILAGGRADGTVRLWDVATRQQIGDPLGADTGAVFSVAFSPDGKTLASGDAHQARLWEMGYLVDTASRL